MDAENGLNGLVVWVPNAPPIQNRFRNGFFRQSASLARGHDHLGSHSSAHAFQPLPLRRAAANSSKATRGQTRLKLTLTRRRLTRTSAPILKSLSRMLPQVATASSVPRRATRRNWFTSKYASVENHSRN